MTINENEKLAYFMRHGSYAYDGELTNPGREDVKTSALEIASQLTDELEFNGLVYVFASPLLRATQSGEIVEDVINNTEGLEAIFTVDNRLACDNYQTGRAAKDEDYQVGIFVSHHPDISDAVGMSLRTAGYMAHRFPK